MSVRHTALCLMLASAMAGAQAPGRSQTADQSGSLTIVNARIVDGNGGVIPQGTIVVRDGRIVSVSEKPPAGIIAGLLVGGDGLTVMPGFIDAHRHVMQGDGARWLETEASARMREFLDAGFTTILSAGDTLEPILELRRRLAAGEIAGPRLIVSGRVPLARTAGAGRGGVDPARLDNSRPPNRPTTPAAGVPDEDTRATVRTLAKAGVDAFKTNITVTPGGPEKATLALVVAEAKKLGIPVITHAVTVEDTIAAVEAGVTTLVHTPHIGHLTDAEVRTIARSGIPMMSTLGVFVPTFARENALVRERTGDDNLPRFRDLDPFPMNTLLSAGQGPVNARLLWEAGVVYGYGTDTRFLPRDALAHELRPLRLVFSAQDIVRIMTRNAAATIGLGSEIGTIEAGKRADLVLLGGNPLEDVDAVLNVKLVVKNGRIVVDRR